MDQDTSKGQDKRNWRERLGIGAQGNKELPKISDDFRKPTPPAAGKPSAPVATPSGRPVVAAKPAPRPATTSTVKPAPMAPRAAAKSAGPPVSPDKLAERLRSQREASTKLAEQRVQVAKQKSEVKPTAGAAAPSAPTSGGGKPKFTFAEEGGDTKSAAPVATPPSKPLVTPPPPQAARPAAAPPSPPPQLSPARPPLGGAVPPLQPNVFTPRPAAIPQSPPPGFPQMGQGQGFPPGGYGQQPFPPYRPIDPSNGYAPPPGYVPQSRGFGVPPQAPSNFPPPMGGPRLNVPPRPEGQRPLPSLNSSYQAPPDMVGAPGPQPGFTPSPRMTRPPLRGPAVPPQGEYEDEFYDEMPSPRGGRASSSDYSNAYRDAEYGYEEEEAPRSKAPLILAGLIVFSLLLAGGLIWGYQKFGKALMSGQTATQEVPAVEPPQTPAKVQPEQPAPQQTTAANPSKKQIYDRIVGDQEVLGGDVTGPAEQPAAIPEPQGTAPQPGGTTGDDAAPLPIPPPPGAGDQQGALDPSSQKGSSETITPAAGESEAAVAAQDSPVAEEKLTLRSVTPPAPGEVLPDPPLPASDATTPVEEVAEATPEPEEPVVAKKPVVKKKAVRSLGAKPVVLVPAKKTAAKKATQVDSDQSVDVAAADAGGLYGDADVTTQAVEPVQPAAPAAAPKKKKTLADLFRNSRNDTADAPVEVASIEQPEPIAPAQPKKATVAAQPVEQAGGGGFVAQLASFRSRAEATKEYARLRAKHSGVLGGFSPIISEATVLGSTRYRLSVGSMASKAQADAVCSSLIKGGERDCLVKKF